MENKIVIHKDANYSKIIFKYLIALIPLVLYGFYKNGIILFANNDITVLEMFKPLLFPILGFILGLLVNFLKHKRINLNLTILNGLIVGMTIPLNTNIILFSVLTFGLLYTYSFIENKFNFNITCLIKLGIVLLLFILSKYDYANSLELSHSYAYSFIDLLFGRQVGGVCSSSFIWIIVSLVYLLSDYYYKKEIPIISYLTYALVCGFSFLFTKDFNTTLNFLIFATPLFTFTFIAPISEYSPYTVGGKLVYSVLIGSLTALLSFIVKYEAAFIATLLVSLLRVPLDALFQKKTK